GHRNESGCEESTDASPYVHPAPRTRFGGRAGRTPAGDRRADRRAEGEGQEIHPEGQQVAEDGKEDDLADRRGGVAGEAWHASEDIVGEAGGQPGGDEVGDGREEHDPARAAEIARR